MRSCDFWEGESTFILATSWHRIAKPDRVLLELLDVQVGTHLDEDGLILAAAVYKRAGEEI